MDTILNKIDQLKKEMKSYRPLSKEEIKRLSDEFIIETTYNSNAIEGNTISLRETALIIQEGITIASKPIKDHLDIIGYKDAFYFILELADKNEDLTEKDIKDIHSLILMQDRQNKGIYRRVPVKILGSLHEPPQPYLIIPQMEKLLLDYKNWKKEKHIIEAIALFHLEFESIHPFIDGNGRTGRLLLNLELIKHGLLPIDIKFIDRDKYYNSFDIYRENNKDQSELASLVADYEVKELNKYIDILRML